MLWGYIRTAWLAVLISPIDHFSEAEGYATGIRGRSPSTSRNRYEQEDRDSRAGRGMLLGRRRDPARRARRPRYGCWIYRWLGREPHLRGHARQPVRPRGGDPGDVRSLSAQL